jgi:hypothetical protein
MCREGKFSSCKLCLGAMRGSIQEWLCGSETSQKIAHFPLDFVCKQKSLAGIGRASTCWPVLHIGETDCVGGVIGLELRCAERKFISLTRSPELGFA